MKLSELLNLDLTDWQNMSNEEIKSAIRTFQGAARKRVSRVTKRFGITPAIDEYYQGGGQFSTTYKNKQKLLNEVQRALSFFRSTTSTVEGAKLATRGAITVLEKIGGLHNIPEDGFWSMYREQLETYNEEALQQKNYESSSVLTRAYELYLKGDNERANNILKAWYEGKNIMEDWED